MPARRSKAAIVLALVAISCLHFHYVYRYPTPELIAFISRVTANALPPRESAPQRAPSAVVTPPAPQGGVADAPVQLSSGRRFAANEAAGRAGMTTVDGELSLVSSAGVNTNAKQQHNQKKEKQQQEPEPSRPDFRRQRFNAKLHMVNQLQLFVDYPIAYWFTVDLDAASWWWMSANLISILHPFFGMAAGYLIVKAASRAGGCTGGGAIGPNGEPLSPALPSTMTPSAGFERSGLLSGISPTAGSGAQLANGAMSPVVDPSASNADGTGPHHQRTRSCGPVTPCGAPAAAPSQSHNGNDFELSNLASSTSNAAAVKQAIQAVEDEEKQPDRVLKGAGSSALFSTVNVRLLRYAAVLFWLRNFLDTLDGVVARVQRHRRGAVVTSTTMGFNGHSLDMVTDTLGVACIAVGICVLLFSKNLVIARGPASMLARFGLRVHIQKDQIFSKVVAVLGLMQVGLTGMCWETFMLRYANLFDAHANTNPAIFELDNAFQVRLTQFLWAASCGDSILSYLIVAICFNKMWEFVQVQFFFGIPWVLALTAYSFFVWYRVILANPTAALIVAENPDLFL